MLITAEHPLNPKFKVRFINSLPLWAGVFTDAFLNRQEVIRRLLAAQRGVRGVRARVRSWVMHFISPFWKSQDTRLLALQQHKNPNLRQNSAQALTCQWDRKTT